MTLFDNLLTIFVLLVIATIVYLKVTGRTFTDLIRDLREAFTETTEEVTPQ